MVREQLTDEQWERLRPLLPPQKPRTGRPAHDHRRIMEAILWLDRPPELGRWQTVSSRFYRWRQQGVWDRVLAALQAQADGRGALDWLVHYLDSTVIRAHQHAAGAKGGLPKRRRSAGAAAASAPNSI